MDSDGDLAAPRLQDAHVFETEDIRPTVLPDDDSLDLDVRAGRFSDSALPIVPGIDPAGEIAKLGEGVDSFAAGDRVGILPAGRGVWQRRRLVGVRTAPV